MSACLEEIPWSIGCDLGDGGCNSLFANSGLKDSDKRGMVQWYRIISILGSLCIRLGCLQLLLDGMLLLAVIARLLPRIIQLRMPVDTSCCAPTSRHEQTVSLLCHDCLWGRNSFALSKHMISMDKICLQRITLYHEAANAMPFSMFFFSSGRAASMSFCSSAESAPRS